MASVTDRRWTTKAGEKVRTHYAGGKPWLARYREYPGGPQKYQSFAKKADAERFLVKVGHELATGSYVDAQAGSVTVAQYADEWMARQPWAPLTRDRVERTLRLHVLPTFGPRPLVSLRRSHVEEWARGLALAPSTVETTVRTFSAMLACAVEDERLAKNPAARARLPKVDRAPFVPMSVDEVHGFVRGLPEYVRAAGVVAAGTGLRQGELFGLTVDRVDFLRRELRVDRQLVTPSKGRPELARPKSDRSYRTVALSGLVVDALSAQLAAFGPGEHGVIFHTSTGSPVSRIMATTYARRAAKTAGVEGRTWHDLRHHHASILLSEGTSPALVAERLGHDVATLLSTYAHVIRSDDDRVRAIVDGSLGVSAEYWLSTGTGS